MSYKYSNVREYQGKLLFEDRKNQNYVEINTDGIKYSRNDETPTSSYFALKFDGKNSAVNFYDPTPNQQASGIMSARSIIFDCSGKKSQSFGMGTTDGVFFKDSTGKKECQMVADGLIITDKKIFKTCILKFENGVLKINGKEIATK